MVCRKVHCRTGSLENVLQLSFEYEHVHCRTGSLENLTFSLKPSRIVHCRTGSLERWMMWFKSTCTVHCRTGSLEIICARVAKHQYVHCRTGSLENQQELSKRCAGVHCRTGSLERQIEFKLCTDQVHCRTGSLEKRQPRGMMMQVHCRTGVFQDSCRANQFLSRLFLLWLGPLWIEHNGSDGSPVSRLAAPPQWMLFSGFLVHIMPFGQQGLILPPVSLAGRDKTDPTMPVLFVIPVHKVTHPLPCRLKTGKSLCAPLWTVLYGSEQRLRVRIIVADTGPSP